MYVVRYKKTFRMTKKVWAHDEQSQASLGDIVRIQPLGYRLGPWKTYTLAKLLHKESNKLNLQKNTTQNNLQLDTLCSDKINL